MDNYIWLDVTTTLNWDRAVVGIVRVESECALYFLSSDSNNIHFCRFDFGKKQYLEVTRNEVREVLNRYQQGQSHVNLNTVSAVSKGQRIKGLLTRIANFMPGKWRKKAYTFALDRLTAYHAVVRSYREFRLAIAEFMSPSNPSQVSSSAINGRTGSRSEVPFRPGDVYISLGLDWSQKDYEYLFSEKRRVGFRVILICYDIIPVKFQHYFFGEVASIFAKHFANLAWCADEILCISECTRRDLTQLLTELGTPIPSMSVVKLGCELPSSATEQPTPVIQQLINNKYILFVSTIERRKNHEVLYRAYTRLIDNGETNLPLLVFVGMAGWGVDDFLKGLKLDNRIQPYIRMLNNIPDSDLLYLYRRAAFTVFPSLYEGWGIPVAESLAAGKFCLASNAASIPEVGEDFVEYLDPWDLPAWTERLKWYFDHPEEVLMKEKRIKGEYRPTAWSETASFVLRKAQELSDYDNQKSSFCNLK